MCAHGKESCCEAAHLLVLLQGLLRVGALLLDGALRIPHLLIDVIRRVLHLQVVKTHTSSRLSLMNDVKLICRSSCVPPAAQTRHFYAVHTAHCQCRVRNPKPKTLKANPPAPPRAPAASARRAPAGRTPAKPSQQVWGCLWRMARFARCAVIRCCCRIQWCRRTQQVVRCAPFAARCGTPGFPRPQTTPAAPAPAHAASQQCGHATRCSAVTPWLHRLPSRGVSCRP